MRTKQLWRVCLFLLLAGPIAASGAVAPIVGVAPRRTEAAPPVVIPVPSVVGLSFDDARARLAGFDVRRSYRASAEPGGTVLEQQPAPPAQAAAGGIVRLVLSDATLRPPPRVSAAEVDGIPAPPAAATSRSQSAVVNDGVPPPTPPLPRPTLEQLPTQKRGSTATMERHNAKTQASPANEVERVSVPNVVGMTAGNAEARLARFSVARRSRSSAAAAGRVIQQIPRASARAAPGSQILLVVSSGPSSAGAASASETLELPNVVQRSFADASGALAEFKVARVEVADAAPPGQVLAQDPAPGTQVRPGSTISLRVSDGSLAVTSATLPAASPSSVATSTPAATQASAPADAAESSITEPAAASASAATTAPVPAPSAAPSPPRAPLTVPRGPTLALIAAVLIGLLMGALLMRRWWLTRPIAAVETVAPTGPAPPEGELGSLEVVAPTPTFTARLDAGDTSIEFAAPPDADETTLEHSRELHE